MIIILIRIFLFHRNDSQAPGHAVQLDGHISAVTSVEFGPDLRSIFSGCEDRTIKMWDIRTGQARICLKKSQGE
jgi:WD40 repeat protein